MTVVITIFLLAFAAFTVIAATMGRHQDDLGTASFTPRQLARWRLAGYGLLAVSFYPSLSRWGVSIAIAAWFALIGFAAITFGLTQTYFPKVTALLKQAIVFVGTLLGSFTPAPFNGEVSQATPGSAAKAPPKAVPPKGPRQGPPQGPPTAIPPKPAPEQAA